MGVCYYIKYEIADIYKRSLNFIYFTTITKQVIQLLFIMLVGTDVCVRMVFVWEGTGVPGEIPPVWLGDHMTHIAYKLLWM